MAPAVSGLPVELGATVPREADSAAWGPVAGEFYPTPGRTSTALARTGFVYLVCVYLGLVYSRGMAIQSFADAGPAEVAIVDYH